MLEPANIRHLADGVRMILGDCREVVPILTMPIYAAIIDPPYGERQLQKGLSYRSFGNTPAAFGSLKRGKPITRRGYPDDDWDNVRFDDKDFFNLILKKCEVTFIFGGNNFAHLLPPSTHWFVWDKNNTMPTMSDAELIWTSLPYLSVRIARITYNGLIGKEEKRVHPTQKPLSIMNWLMSRLSKEGNYSPRFKSDDEPEDHAVRTILDPFTGSGSTGVAAIRHGYSFIGIERRQKYFDIACKRLEQALKEPSIIVKKPKKIAKPGLIGTPNVSQQTRVKRTRRVHSRNVREMRQS